MNNYRKFLESQGYDVSPQWPELLKRVEQRIIKKGGLIVDDSKPNFNIYFLDKGCVRFFVVKNDIEQTHDFIEAPNAFGTNVGINPNEFNLVNVQALTDVEVYVIEPDDFGYMNSIYPGFKEIGEHTIGQLLAKRNKYARMLAQNSAEERYNYFMENHASLLKVVPQHIIASYLGMTPESLSRIRKRMFSKPNK